MDKVKQGKRNRINGTNFERRVRSDLESKGRIVDRWTNNLSDYPEENINLPSEERKDRKLIPAKSNRFRARSTGFPDFIVFVMMKMDKELEIVGDKSGKVHPGIAYDIVGVECKINGKLDKIEREKCKWYLKNEIFSQIIIASKHKKKGRIKIHYEEFKL